MLKEDEDESLKDVDSKNRSKFGGLGSAADNAYRQERHREKENMTDFIEKKRQMFLVQMSLDTKRAEIRKLEEQAHQREEALRKSEQMLEEDASRFELFLKMNDQKAVDAIRKAEAETKSKQDKVQEIKKLNAQIAAVKSEMAKYEESLEECQAYKKFLDELTPQEYIQEQLEAHVADVVQKRDARKVARRVCFLFSFPVSLYSRLCLNVSVSSMHSDKLEANAAKILQMYKAPGLLHVRTQTCACQSKCYTAP